MSFPSQRPVRVFALGAMLGLVLGGRASAQTIYVRHAPAGATIEAQLNTAPSKTATADDAGEAMITLDLPANTTETLVSVFVDTCGRQIVVRLLSPAAPPPPPAAGCTRSDAGAQFVIRSVTSFVIDVAGSNASVRMRQGPPFAAWLSDTPEAAAGGEGVAAGVHPGAGLSVFGGGGIASYSQAKSLLCGDAVCTGNRFSFGGEAGVSGWVLPFLGAEVSYLKPTQASVSGSGPGFTFDSALDSRLLLLAVNVGGVNQNLRFYGRGGADYHQATFSQTEQNASGTQTTYLETKGWGWLAGGGFEAWIASRLAIYVDGDVIFVKGDNANGGEGRMNDHVIKVMGGMRLRLF
jgi:hypothetical protein